MQAPRVFCPHFRKNVHSVADIPLKICCWWLIEHNAGEKIRGQTIPIISSFLSFSQRGEATVGDASYELIKACKMEINPSDYTAQYLTI